MARYVYDLRIARERASTLKRALKDVTVLYAVKANGHPAVVDALAQACDGLDVASIGELALAGKAQRIVLSGPAKTEEFLRAGLARQAVVNVESLTELHRIIALNQPARITLRVNRSHAKLPGSHAMTGTPTQFGIDESQLGEAIALARESEHIDLLGFHLHAVSNNLDVNAHNEFMADAVAWAHAQPIEVRQINLGGGFGVDYTGSRAFDPYQMKIPKTQTELIVEPGRWLVAGAGTYHATVMDLKRSHGRWFAIVRGGTHHFRLPAAWGYSHPFTIVPHDEWDEPFARPTIRDVEVDVAGELCTPRDVLTRGQFVSRLRVGDELRYEKTGAYGWDISHHQFLRHPSPQFVILS
ncbi:alanine racemase [Allorhizocola rhizosphaerae]|uniref:alanine racemase n=1 Tax=Allorhizocola rhizosphaerae TaxID=1872709 RepID=UPI000E3C529D|nr:alanine racemase [Allorhizocola rhizosphaerae]